MSCGGTEKSETGVIPFADEVRFLVTLSEVKVLKAGILSCHSDDLVHPVLFHHIGHDVVQIDVDLPFRYIPQFRVATFE